MFISALSSIRRSDSPNAATLPSRALVFDKYRNVDLTDSETRIIQLRQSTLDLIVTTPWDAWATLTFDTYSSLDGAGNRFENYLDALSLGSQPYGLAIAERSGHSLKHTHLHAFLGGLNGLTLDCGSPKYKLKCPCARHQWRCGIATVKAFEPNQSGAGAALYAVKELGTRSEAIYAGRFPN